MEHRRRAKEIDLTIGHHSVTKIIDRRADLRDLYPILLRLPWTRFLPLVVLAYLVVDILFALLYYSAPDAIGGMHGTDRFTSDFFFSAETLSTVGYGQLFPATLYGHIIATIESLSGMILIAVVTGLIFVRFSKPWPRVIFARKIVIRPFDGKPALMVRIGNERDSLLLNAEVRMTLMLEAVTSEGTRHFSSYPLRMQDDHVPMFALAWVGRHEISADSPLYGLDKAQMKARRMRLVVSVTGLDEVLTETVYAAQRYTTDDVHFDHQYAAMDSDDQGRHRVDFAYFHEIEPWHGPVDVGSEPR